MRISVFLLVSSLFASSLQAQQEISETIVTDRPTQTFAPYVAGKGVFQVESGLSYLSLGSTKGSQFDQWALPNILWRLGLSNRLEFRVVTQPEFQKQYVSDTLKNKEFGFADIQIGFKVNILNTKNGKTQIGFLSHLVAPTGTDGISISKYGVITRLAFSHVLFEKLNLGYNLGYDYFGIENGNVVYTLVFGTGITSKLSVYAELFGGLYNLDAYEGSLDFGFTYLLSNNIQLDYSYGLGLNFDMNYHSLGFSFRLGDF